MNNEIKKTENFDKVAVEYLNAMGLQLPQKYATQFIELAKAFGLNPFKREIYAVGYGQNFNIITGYEVYLKRAERTGKLDGWNVTVEGKVSDNSLRATIEIFRKDWSHAFKHQVFYAECVQTTKEGRPTSVWAKMPVFMTKKVVIAQGFRLCFSDEMGGMPYTADEMPEIAEASTSVAVVESNPPVQSVEEPKQLTAAQSRLVELYGTGLFSREEKERINAQWKQDQEEALKYAEHIYAEKSNSQSSGVPF